MVAFFQNRKMYKFKGDWNIAQHRENWRQRLILWATDFDFCKKGQIFFSPDTSTERIFVLIRLCIQILFFLTLKKQEIVQMWFSQDINLIKRNSSLPEWSIFSYFRDKKHRVLTEQARLNPSLEFRCGVFFKLLEEDMKQSSKITLLPFQQN